MTGIRFPAETPAPDRGFPTPGRGPLTPGQDSLIAGDGSPVSSHGHPMPGNGSPVSRHMPPVPSAGPPGLKSTSQVQYSIPLAFDPSVSQFPSQMALAAVNMNWDIREHIRALPTKADIQQLIAVVKLSKWS